MTFTCNLKGDYAFYTFFEKYMKVTEFLVASHALILMWPLILDVVEKYEVIHQYELQKRPEGRRSPTIVIIVESGWKSKICFLFPMI